MSKKRRARRVNSKTHRAHSWIWIALPGVLIFILAATAILSRRLSQPNVSDKLVVQNQSGAVPNAEVLKAVLVLT